MRIRMPRAMKAVSTMLVSTGYSLARVYAQRKHSLISKVNRFTFLFLLVSAFLCVLPPLAAQVPVALAPVARQQFFSATGLPLAGGCISTYNAGTTTPAATYLDVSGLIQNTNPITLDAGGFATIYLANQAYKIQVNAAPPAGACSPVNLGPQIYIQDNVSAYQIVNSLPNLFLAPVTSDPGGIAGEIGYRSDIPCFRGFTTLWDCFVELTIPQTLTNKIIPTSQNSISGGAQGQVLQANNVGNFIPVYGNILLPYTSSATGTGTNLLVKMVNSGPVTVQTTSTTDAGGVIGICLVNCGPGPINSVVTVAGITNCVFDGPAAIADYLVISPTVAGNCHDAGAVYPVGSGQIIGRANVTVPGAGSYSITLFPAEFRPPYGAAASVNLTGQVADITSTTMLTPAVNGFYRFSCFIVETTNAGTSSTLPSCGVVFTDPDSGGSHSLVVTATNAANTVGTLGAANSGVAYANFYAQGTKNISYYTSGYASNPGATMSFALRIKLEGPL